jgi:hypothetical protein
MNRREVLGSAAAAALMTSLSPAAKAQTASVRGTLNLNSGVLSYRFKSNPAHPLNSHVLRAIGELHGLAVSGVKTSMTSIQVLRGAAEQAVPIIHSEYMDIDEERYRERWSLVYLLGRLRHPAALPALDAIIVKEVPAEKSTNLHTFSTTAEEVIMRTTAVEALRQLSALGEAGATSIILHHAVSSPTFSIRRACVQAYLAHGGTGARAELLRVLPNIYHHILNIRVMSGRDVPQPLFEPGAPNNKRHIKPPHPWLSK